MCRDLSTHTHTHTDGEEAAFCVCRAHEALPPLTSAVPQPCGLSHLPQHRRVPVSPRDSLRSSSPLFQTGLGPPEPGQGEGCEGQRILHQPGGCTGAHLPEQLPGLGAPFPVCGIWGALGRGLLPAVPALIPRSRTPQPRFPFSRSAAWPPLLAQPILLCGAGVFTSSPGRGNVFPQLAPKSRDPAAPPGTPSPPGIPSPSAGSSGVCTHPLPAAVALSLETGSDSGSITFSALSLSGNFCGNPSEIGG